MKLFSSQVKNPPIYSICAPLMMEGAALPVEMRVALFLPSHPLNTRLETEPAQAILKGSVMCCVGPKQRQKLQK